MSKNLTASDSRGNWRRTFGVSVYCATSLVAVVVASRRLNGAFSVDIPPAVGCLAATLCTLLCLAAHAASTSWERFSTTRQPEITGRVRSVVLIVLTAGLPLLLGASLLTASSAAAWGYLAGLTLISTVLASLHGVSLRGETVTMAQGAQPLLGGEIAAAGESVDEPSLSQPSSFAVEEAVRSAASAPEMEAATVADEEIEDDDESAAGEHLSQWLNRSTLPQGGESIDGGARVLFAAGQKSACVHLAFVPPLCGTPEIACEIVESDLLDVRTKVAYAQTFGARIELRRSDATSAASVVFRFAAECPVRVARAA